MSDYKYLKASDGTGEAVLAHVDATRAALATTLVVDSVDNWPDEFICTTGELLPSGLLDPATMTQFRGHLNSGDIIIDEFEPGYVDNGNTTDEVAIIKMTSGWADLVAEYARVATPSGIITPYAGAAAPDAWLLCNGASLLRATYPDLFTAIGTTYGSVDGTHFTLPDLRSRVPVGAGAGTLVATKASRASNVITVTGIDNTSQNGFQTGEAVLYTAASGAMTGLTHNTTYYLIRTGNLTFSLATTLANALAGTAIALSSDGTGTQTFTLTHATRTLADRGGEDLHALTVAEMPSHKHVQQLGGAVRNSAVAGGVNVNGDQNTSDTQYTGGDGTHNNMQPFLALNYIIKV